MEISIKDIIRIYPNNEGALLVETEFTYTHWGEEKKMKMYYKTFGNVIFGKKSIIGDFRETT